ncbi:unnamed protein product [Lactuca saligna]|uniref:Uncharacterized protein n=1 Tax=Lactuca saligna TaxID=75948 RepID=A0AA35ZEW3_LACSI|nr:unnamed protein product [Lactuca saligna]
MLGVRRKYLNWGSGGGYGYKEPRTIWKNWKEVGNIREVPMVRFVVENPVTVLSMEHILIKCMGDGPLESPMSAIMENEVGDSRFGKNKISDPLRKIPCKTVSAPMKDVIHVC